MKTNYDDGVLKIRSMIPGDAKVLYDTYLSYGRTLERKELSGNC